MATDGGDSPTFVSLARIWQKSDARAGRRRSGGRLRAA
jgi:hypothetical protein